MTNQTITAEQFVEEVLSDYPKTVTIFMDHGMPCLVCGEPAWGTIAENAERYNIELESLIKDLNASITPAVS